jgi:hypothetical protein
MSAMGLRVLGTITVEDRRSNACRLLNFRWTSADQPWRPLSD